MLNSIGIVAQKLNITEKQVNVVLQMLDEGATIPFIARYRKQATDGLDEEIIGAINVEYKYSSELLKRKETIVAILKEQNLLTDELLKAINAANVKSDLENIYEPFKTGKKTKASEAIRLGLEPLAKLILNTRDAIDVQAETAKFVNQNVKDTAVALEGAKFIIAQWMSQDLKLRQELKDFILETGKLESKKNTKTKDEKERFKNYYEFAEEIKKIPNHRILALNRGEEIKVLLVTISFPEDKILPLLLSRFTHNTATSLIISEAFEDACKRLIIPSITREIRTALFERAEVAAIKLFADNLETMLLTPAIKNKTVLAIDPAFASGCKMAVISPSSKLEAIYLMKPNAPLFQTEASEKTLVEAVQKHRVNIIVIGNGTASRETESFVVSSLKKHGLKVPYNIISESGASVYSASKIAIEEFPELSVEQRSAIHLGRKFQDPLNELVKIDPKAIGVGQYQHDVDQNALSQALDFKIEKVVNEVGVDLNTATEIILTHISSISKTLAKNIVEFRGENGIFRSRGDLQEVKGMGKKAFEQAVGFLRIHDSNIFYDKTNIHPESYHLADQVVQKLGLDLQKIDLAKLEQVNSSELAKQLNSNHYDIEIIINALKNPGKDIRDERDMPLLKTDVLSIENLEVGMKLEGSVQNITDFGAFVYIGIKQAALIHVSNLSSKFVKHPSEVVKTGQKVMLEIIGIDHERDRIQGKLVE